MNYPPSKLSIEWADIDSQAIKSTPRVLSYEFLITLRKSLKEEIDHQEMIEEEGTTDNPTTAKDEVVTITMTLDNETTLLPDNAQ